MFIIITGYSIVIIYITSNTASNTVFCEDMTSFAIIYLQIVPLDELHCYLRAN